MSTENTRPCPRELFLTPERRLEVYFHTSNEPKYFQARAVFRRFGLELKHFRSHTEPYHEDYSAGKQVLLDRAIKEVLAEVGSRDCCAMQFG